MRGLSRVRASWFALRYQKHLKITMRHMKRAHAALAFTIAMPLHLANATITTAQTTKDSTLQSQSPPVLDECEQQSGIRRYMEYYNTALVKVDTGGAPANQRWALFEAMGDCMAKAADHAQALAFLRAAKYEYEKQRPVDGPREVDDSLSDHIQTVRASLEKTSPKHQALTVNTVLLQVNATSANKCVFTVKPTQSGAWELPK